MINFKNTVIAQTTEIKAKEETEIRTKYAMPLYLDLPTEMDVEKGYKEVNIAGGFNSYKNYNYIRSVVEYAFAPVKKLGIEIELPFSLYNSKSEDPEEKPENKLDGLRIGSMYTFAVFDKAKAAFAAGFFNEFETTPFKQFGNPLFEGNDFHPFLSASKVWGNRFHTLIYTGPAFISNYAEHHSQTDWKINTTLNYQINSKENFIGIEVNQTAVSDGKFETIVRPQLHVSLSQQLAVGIVASIPVSIENMNAGGFLRVIYMP